jgi:signal transduction histidine kinase
MTSLRRRLTISYTVLVGAFISIVAIALTWLAFDAVVQPLKNGIETYSRTAREIAASDPYLSVDGIVARLRTLVAQPDVDVFSDDRFGPRARDFRSRPDGPAAGRGEPPPGRSGPPPGQSGPPPGEGGPPPPGPGGQPNGRDGPPPRGAEPEPPNAAGFELTSLLGVHPTFVVLGSHRIFIFADPGKLQARVRTYVFSLAAALVLSFIAAWLIARWIAAQVVEPLDAVTVELRRFAGGDFTPRELPSRRVSDLGALIDAFNGAAAQVVLAFDERERAEQRMRRFLADAGHELRTPLSIVTAYIEVLRKGAVDDPQLRERAFSTLTTEATRMRRLVERLVALARLEQPETTQPEVVDLGALASDAVLAIGAARGREVECAVESGAFVLADPADLHEAITNLVDNAIKYGAGSPVRVSVDHESDAVALRVRDHGPGIPAADREKIFERFYRGTEQQTVEGSGLGLAIATRAAKRAGGELSLERSGDGETVFVLRLPLHVANPAR